MTTARNHLTDLARFAPLLPGYQPREPQLEMADAVEDVIGSGATLLVEAETGTGKTLAYLVPALLSEGPTLVSTGTKSLQDQLFFKDLPMVKKALNLPRKVALLKGRANYLCPYRLELHQEDARFLTRETVGQMQIVAHWAGRTRTGDIAELQQIPEDAPVWPWVTSTADNCLGTECPRYNECPLMKARKEAQEADLVVVNHHLFFADAALRGNGAASELLPTANTVIFDEAHQLPEIAAAFFADTLSTRQIQELGRDSLSEAGHTAADLAELNRLVAAVDKGGMDLRLSLGDGERREPWTEVADNKAVVEAGETLLQALQELDAFLGPLAKASRGMDACSRRASEQVDCLAAYLKGGQPNRVYWFETFKRSVVLHSTPLSVAAQLRAQRERHPCSWILTSATLSVGGRFEHIQHRLGLDSARTLRLESPFDFKRQAVFYAPEGLPAPNDREYTAQLTNAMVPVINAAKGRTFFLFTSHRALREAAGILRQKIDFPLLVQGESGRRELLEAFREKGNAVLLGTSSFWEGIDVRGEALSCVIIDKLPFGSPGDPVAAARIEHINRNGGNAFRDYQLPQAVLALRQGAGRLIRDPKDTGLLVVADPRLLTRSYGKLFVNSLPNMTRTRKLDVVQRFFDYLARQGLEAEKDGIMTRILALETAGETCSVALLDDGNVIERFEHAPRRQTELVLPMVEGLLADAGVRLKDLDGIAFGHGPGAFTGVRVAAAVTQGLAFSADLPVVGISTLAACALSAQAIQAHSHVIACFDARMGEVYLGAYECEGGAASAVLNDGLFNPDALPDLPSADWMIIGSGLVYQDALVAAYGASRCVIDAHPHAKAVAQLALSAFERGEGVSAEQAQPVYLRDQVIQGAVR